MPTAAVARAADAPTREATLTIGLAVLGVFVTYVPISATSVALTTIGTATGASTADLQWVSDAYVIPMAATVLSAGVLGDLYGRRRAFIVGMLLTVLGAIVAGSAGLASGSTAVHTLWLGQAVSGLGAGLLLPTTLALIGHAVPDPRRRGRFIGMWATGLMLGLALGPIISGSLLEATDDLGWIFAPTAALALAAGGVALALLPESKAPEGRRPDWGGQACATVTIASSIYATISGGQHGWSATSTWLGYAVAVIALIGFVAVELTTETPLMDLRLFRSADFTAAGVSALVALFSVVGAFFLLSLFLGYVQHLSALEIGGRMVFVTGVGALVPPFLGPFLHRLQPLLLLAGGLAVSAVGVVALTGIEAGTGYADLAWRLAIFGVGLAITMTTVSTAAINAVSWQQAGMAAATNTALRQYGGALGPAILGVVFSDRLAAGATPTEAVHTALVVNATLLGIAALLCLAAGVVDGVRRRVRPSVGMSATGDR
ncbi:MFS transporter [Nocardioides lianchengensis]|uniref:Drug resistance transporter, EmrB/QacA subfamily n=1 Tax=Nocardioides lianchengensis TaxID=1045774 RepID=A0A1G6M6I7_9ACTN|nr:MFS transporter [Nocardioides lianchengensis]NYG12339.1 EmrB/QacA subfamily drug resistance transporter [Nocardioides lianchengensis]SDC51083.1 drug resistance transporter, EmrB/QacA subfamily [Nocardioides lianchengensis]